MATLISSESSADGMKKTKKAISPDEIPDSVKRKWQKIRAAEVDTLSIIIQGIADPLDQKMALYQAYRDGTHGVEADQPEAEKYLAEYVAMKYPAPADQMLEWYKIFKYGTYGFNRNYLRDKDRTDYCLQEYISIRSKQGEDKLKVECEVIRGFLHGLLGLQQNATDAEWMMERVYNSIELGDREKWSRFLQFLENENIENNYSAALRVIRDQQFDLSWLSTIKREYHINAVVIIWYVGWMLAALYAIFASWIGFVSVGTFIAGIVFIVMAIRAAKSYTHLQKWRNGLDVWTKIMSIVPHRQLTPMGEVFSEPPAAHRENQGCLFVIGYFVLAFLLYGIAADSPSYNSNQQQNQMEKTAPIESKTNENVPPKAEETSPPKPKENHRDEAVKAFSAFHKEITNHNLKTAYSYLGQNIQNEWLYDGWAAGFENTVSSTPKDIEVAEESENRVVLTYNLEAQDNPGGTKNFTGTAVLVRTDDGWKIDEMENQLVRTLENELMLGNIAIGDKFESAQKKLGKPQKQKTENGRKRYFYPAMEIYCEDNIITALVSNSSQVATPSGIHEGSSLQDVLNAYGSEYAKSRYENLDLYEYETTFKGRSVMVRFAVNSSTNRVDYISIRRR